MTSRLPRPLVGLLLAAGLLLGATASPATALPPPSDSEWGETRIHWLLNEERRIRGLAPVSRSAGADSIAQYSANVQAWYGRLGHNPNLGEDVRQRVGPWWFVGENVGCSADADRLHSLWMRSSSHVANMLRGNVDTIGVGAVYARGCLWATVVYIDRQ